MVLIFGIFFSYVYSVFYYLMPINLNPIFIFYSIRKYGFNITLIFSLIFGIISDLIYPNKIWVSPIFYIILSFLLNFFKDEFTLAFVVFIIGLLGYETLKFFLDFKTPTPILISRIILTSLIFYALKFSL
jgi:ABC-type methionine transport system permease subunit